MDLRAVHDACRLAIEIARAGERAEPPMPSPAAIRRVLGFQRLSAATYAAVAAVVDEDDEFRARVVAALGDEAPVEVGPAGRLWLERPDGWRAVLASMEAAREEPAAAPTGEIARLQRERDGAERTAERARRDADQAEAARRRAESRLAEVGDQARADAATIEDLRDALERLGDERNRAVRDLKAVEADLADARRDLRVARQATTDAEAEMAHLRRSSGTTPPGANPAGSAPTTTGSPTDGPKPASRVAASDPLPPDAAPPTFDAAAVRAAVDAAAAAAATLSHALGDAARALAPERDGGDPLDGPARRGHPGPGHRRRGRPVRRRSRERPALPFGVLDGTPDAHRALLRGRHLIVVDGYNLARTAWQGIEPEEERRRTVAALEELRARTGVEVLVVFDGIDGTVAPVASRRVQVRFSPTDRTADEVIVDLVHDLPANRPVVVVTSDREVAEGAEAGGAIVVSSAAFLTALGR